jgi:hypothetical protein
MQSAEHVFVSDLYVSIGLCYILLNKMDELVITSELY